MKIYILIDFADPLSISQGVSINHLLTFIIDLSRSDDSEYLKPVLLHSEKHCTPD